MRKELENLGCAQRHTFVGTFERFGYKNGYKEVLPTVLLTNVHLVGKDKILTDHLWFNKTKGFAQQNLQPGDEVQFDGRVEQYEKGYKGYRKDVFSFISDDYKISRPTNVKNLSHPVMIAKVKYKRRTKEEIEKDRQLILQQIREEEKKRKAEEEYKKAHPEEFIRMATENQVSYMHAISEKCNILCDGLKTFDEVSLYLDCFAPCMLIAKRKEQSIETFERIQEAIAQGLKKKEVLEKLQISSSTYQKYKDSSWLVENSKLDFSREIATYQKRREILFNKQKQE